MFHRPASVRRRTASVAVLGLVLPLTAGTSSATPSTPPANGRATVVASTPGSTTALAGYAIQSTAKVTDSPAAVSSPGYPTTGWVTAAPRSTVLAALLAAGKYADPFYSTNQQKIPKSDFTVPWWYRSDFTVADTASRTYLDFSGVISAADVYVNGKQVADKGAVTGAYTQHELDVSELVRSGTNTVAFRIQPNDPKKNLTMGWIDWLQPPPDENMGIVRDVVVRRGGRVALRDAHVVTSLAVPSLSSADLTVKAQARNDSAAPVTATVSGTIGWITFNQDVTLKAHETKPVTFTPADYPQLRLTSPQVWWPAGMGGATAVRPEPDGVGRRERVRYGTRVVRHPRCEGPAERRWRAPVLGQRAPAADQGRAAGPRTSILRWDRTYVEDRLKYALDLGLNTIRLEGHIEPDEFFDLADRYGILTLPGWECCDKWEGQVNGGESGDKWTAADYPVAKASMAAEAARLRDHPSVISFLIGSDFAPDKTIEKNYVDALKAADWPTPVVAAASDNSAPINGEFGHEDDGPVRLGAAGLLVQQAEGGATGFNSETSAGPDIPTLDTLRRMLSPAELDTLWKNPRRRSSTTAPPPPPSPR